MATFNPQKEEKEVISLRLPTTMVQELDEQSVIYGMSRNEFIVQSIRFALDNIDKETGKAEE